MNGSKTIKGLSLKVGPLGENDRLLTLLSETEGITRLAVPGARRPKSSLSATAPLTYLELQITAKSGLRRVKQIKVLRSFSKLGEQLETLATAQSLSELSLLLVGNNDPQPSVLKAILIHLERLEKIQSQKSQPLLSLAICVQGCLHLLALGGYGLPVQKCCKTGKNLEPPLGNWEWRCSLIPEEGLTIGNFENSIVEINASELALLQILLKENLPIKKNGELLGPKESWLKLLKIIECWTETHLNHHLNTIEMFRKILLNSY